MSEDDVLCEPRGNQSQPLPEIRSSCLFCYIIIINKQLLTETWWIC